MTTSINFKIGEKLEIEPVKVKKNTNIKSIFSQLVDKKNDYLYISSPIKHGVPYPLNIGQQIKIMLYRDEKGMYCFTGEVIDKITIHLPMYIIAPLSAPEKIQRRYYYRLKTLIKVNIRVLNENDVIEGYTKDISGGGMKVIAKKTVELGKKLELKVFLNDNKELTMEGEVIRVVRDPISNEYEVGVKYSDISDNIRNQIVAFIFAKQRELRQKGLI
ncbi:flagellar brake protein [Natronincola ferrireducens]|uniref:C-di-GMP-binding flagellar brake protein YcgR, contains PilZNR and PilZ domains n=1 Tax=Natronincola ferrireducens TaxID=393762 RepID=A0A1G9C309_9FIRM|nr:PilZ domain-containing protein [Natronincola ferrireducens]SDK46050.1 c-di-GMP-binding flagellar brake protein YcgR, contains PilZNR and PilZ domains [Natronincola ferrireducens]